jgi:hypothetical protein
VNHHPPHPDDLLQPDDPPEHDTGVLPLRYCSNTLLKLTLQYEKSFDANEACRLGRFHRFTNLTSLSVHPFTNELCDYISSASVQLVQLGTAITKHGNIIQLGNVIDMFSAPSLRNLQHLRIAIYHRKEWSFNYPRIHEAICQNLGSLENLILGLGFDTSWCTQWRQLEKLKTLRWYVPASACHDSLRVVSRMGQYQADPDSKWESMPERLRGYLYESASLPVVEHLFIRVMDRYSYREVCDSHTGPSWYG